MTQIDLDTICAIATPPGRSGIGIVRISGPQTLSISKSILGFEPLARRAYFCNFCGENGTSIDQGIALYFASPRSFTGEDVLELQGHGGPLVLNTLLLAAQHFGARLARPGEFSERSFLNDKMDLAQLEAIADLIDASTEQAAKSALRTLSGQFSELINLLVNKITELRVYIEASIDFTDEEIDFLSEGSVLERLGELLDTLQGVLKQARQGAILREGMHVVIAGEPNAGKSSLLNVLVGKESAIVTEIPGTTRDVLRETINVDGMPVHIIDTAGLRDSQDKVEQEGVRRARQAISEADQVLLLIDSQLYPCNEATIRLHIEALNLSHQLLGSKKLTVVFNKIDLLEKGSSSLTTLDENDFVFACLKISSLSGEGVDCLREHLKKSVGYDSTEEGSFAARRRHIDALLQAQENLVNAKQQMTLGNTPELVAEELRLAQQHLGEITGKFSTEDLLGKIFSSFCIGK